MRNLALHEKKTCAASFQNSAHTWLHRLADALPADAFIEYALTTSAHHAFWHALLPADSVRGTALVVESRLGAVTASVSAHYKDVISWHTLDTAAEKTSALLAYHDVKNTRIVVAGKLDELDVQNIDALIVVAPDQDPIQQWTAHALSPLLEFAKAHLSKNGVLVLQQNNRWTYRRDDVTRETDHSHSTRSALFTLQKRIRASFAWSDTYVSKAFITATQSPPPDYVPLSVEFADEQPSRAALARIKAAVVNSKPARYCWPSYLLLAGPSRPSSLLDRIVAAVDSGMTHTFGKAHTFALKRVIPGNAEVSIFIATIGEGAGRSDVIVRIPASARGRALCDTNAHALEVLKHSAFSHLVPRLIKRGIVDTSPFSIESRCGGHELHYGSPVLNDALGDACRVMLRIHQSQRSYSPVSAELFDQQIGPAIQELMGFADELMCHRLAGIRDALRRRLTGQHASIGLMHGDFKLGNMLFDRDQKLQSLIDWDSFSENGFQLFDYLTHLLYAISAETGKNLIDVYLDNLLPWKLPEHHHVAVANCTSQLAPDESAFQSVRIAFWFWQLQKRIQPVYKAHTELQRLHLHPAINVIESLLEIPRSFQEPGTRE
jgi:hypothetical protein